MQDKGDIFDEYFGEKIINNINVIDCEYYSEIQHVMTGNNLIVDISDACLRTMKTTNCCENPNCIYKKMKRLESENEMLKATIIKVKDIIENGCYPEFDWLGVK